MSHRYTCRSLPARSRDMIAASVARSALAAIGNAEAVPAGQVTAVRGGSPHVAGSVAGLGAAEAERRCLTEAEIAEIIDLEVAERLGAAAGYELSGQAAQASRLRREAQVLAEMADPDCCHPGTERGGRRGTTAR